jgi:hypothetical protein
MTLDTFLPVFGVVLVAIGLAVAAMAVGVMFKRPCLRGSCGGPALRTASGKKVSCSTCPNRKRDAAEAEDTESA